MYFHGKTTDGRRFTLAGIYDGDKLKLGLSLCSKKDCFVKKTGRAKALGRIYASGQRGKFEVTADSTRFLDTGISLGVLPSNEIQSIFNL